MKVQGSATGLKSDAGEVLVQAYLQEKGLKVPFEVETRTLEEVEELCGLVDAGKAPAVTRIMLDNMVKRTPGQPFMYIDGNLGTGLIPVLYWLPGVS